MSANISNLRMYLSQHGHKPEIIQSVLGETGEGSVEDQAHAAYQSALRAVRDYSTLGTCIATWMGEHHLNNDLRAGEQP